METCSQATSQSLWWFRAGRMGDAYRAGLSTALRLRVFRLRRLQGNPGVTAGSPAKGQPATAGMSGQVQAGWFPRPGPPHTWAPGCSPSPAGVTATENSKGPQGTSACMGRIAVTRHDGTVGYFVERLQNRCFLGVFVFCKEPVPLE